MDAFWPDFTFMDDMSTMKRKSSEHENAKKKRSFEKNKTDGNKDTLKKKNKARSQLDQVDSLKKKDSKMDVLGALDKKDSLRGSFDRRKVIRKRSDASDLVTKGMKKKESLGIEQQQVGHVYFHASFNASLDNIKYCLTF